MGTMRRRTRENENNDADFRLWRLLDHTRYAISRSREMELAVCGLTPEQAYVLDILQANHGRTTINDLSERTLRRHHTVSTLIGRMEGKGLLIKEKDAGDARQYRIVITDKGIALYKQIKRQSIMEAFSVLSAAEKADLSRYLSRLLVQSHKMLGRDIRTDSAINEVSDGRS